MWPIKRKVDWPYSEIGWFEDGQWPTVLFCVLGFTPGSNIVSEPIHQAVMHEWQIHIIRLIRCKSSAVESF